MPFGLSSSGALYFYKLCILITLAVANHLIDLAGTIGENWFNISLQW